MQLKVQKAHQTLMSVEKTRSIYLYIYIHKSK